MCHNSTSSCRNSLKKKKKNNSISNVQQIEPTSFWLWKLVNGRVCVYVFHLNVSHQANNHNKIDNSIGTTQHIEQTRKRKRTNIIRRRQKKVFRIRITQSSVDLCSAVSILLKFRKFTKI